MGERTLRGELDRDDLLPDWVKLAREHDVPIDEAEELVAEALRQGEELRDPRGSAHDCYVELLEAARPQAGRPSPGKVTLAMRLGPQSTEPGRGARAHGGPLEPGKRTLTSYLEARAPQSLDPGVRDRMGRLFGADFSDVRVHRDSPEATGSTRALVKEGEIHFRDGAYQPGTPEGERVIAHELAHVVQQRGGSGERDGSRRELEREADHAAAEVLLGRPAQIALRAPAAAYAFDDAEEHDEDEKDKEKKARRRDAKKKLAAENEAATRGDEHDAATGADEPALALGGDRRDPGAPPAAGAATRTADAPAPLPPGVEGTRGGQPLVDPTRPRPPDDPAAPPAHDRAPAALDAPPGTATPAAAPGDHTHHAAAGTPAATGADAATAGPGSGAHAAHGAPPDGAPHRAQPHAAAHAPAAARGGHPGAAPVAHAAETDAAETHAEISAEAGEAGPETRARHTDGEIEFAPPDLSRLLPPPAPEETPEQRAAMEQDALARDTADRQRASGSLHGFRTDGGHRIAELRSLQPQFDRELGGAETRAIATITSSASVQVRLVRAQVAQAMAAARSQAAALRAQIEGDYQGTVRTIEESTRAARATIDRARQTALDGTNTAQQNQLAELGRLYASAESAFRAAANTAGGSATSMGASRAAEYRSHKINREDSFLDGHLTDNRCDAQAEAAEKVSKAYHDELVKEGDKQVDELRKRRPTDEAGVRTVGDEARRNLETAYQNAVQGLEAARTQSLDNARQSRTQLLGHVDSTLSSTVAGLGRHEHTQAAAIQGQAHQLTASIRQQRQRTSTALDDSLKKAIEGLEQGISALVDGVRGKEVPEPDALDASIAQASGQLDQQIAQARQALTQGSTQGAQGLTVASTQGVQSLTQAGTAAVTSAHQTAAGARQAFSTIGNSARTSLRELGAGHQKAVDGNAKAADTGFQGIVTGLRNSYQQLSRNFEQGAQRNADAVRDGLTAVVNRDLPGAISAEAQKARDQVQPRWKSVLKWVIIIAIVLVVAIVLGPMVIGAVAGLAAGLGASAAAAGVIGAVVGGALVGAATSAVTTVIDNAFAGRDLTTGLGMAIAMGALGGALGGAASGLLAGPMQGMTQLGRFALQVGVDVTLDTAMNLATGNFSWENFGTSLFMSVLTNGVGAHPRVHAAQQHYMSKGYGAGFEAGLGYSQRNVAQPNVSMPADRLHHVTDGDSYGPNSPNAGKWNSGGGHMPNNMMPRAQAEGLHTGNVAHDPISGVGIEGFQKPTGQPFKKSMFPPNMTPAHIEAAGQTGLQRALTGAPGTTHTPPPGPNQNGRFTATVVTPDGHPIIVEGFYKPNAAGGYDIQSVFPHTDLGTGTIPVVPGSRDVPVIPGYATPPDTSYGDREERN